MAFQGYTNCYYKRPSVQFLLSLPLLVIVILILITAEFSQAQQQDIPPPPRKRDDRTSDTTRSRSSSYPQPSVENLDVYEKATNQDDKTKRQLLAPFDTDIRKDCRSILTHCQSDIFSHAYLQCPAMCTKYLEQEGMKGTAEDNPDALWDAGMTLRTFQGKRIDADRFEGHVTVIAILPMLPGMAFYYYEMMETLHSKFTPKVEFVILPIDVGEGVHIKIRDDSKVVILEEESAIETHPWVQHLTSIRPRSGAASKNHRGEIVQVDLPTDRLTVYIVSSDGYFVERMTVPTMAALQRTIGIYLKTIGYDDL